MENIREGHGGMAMPVRKKERFAILDILRGFALVGIAVANFPEFALFTFLKPDAVAAMPTAGADRWVRFLQYVFVDGKFYTIFSLLFGIGFSIIISNAMRRGASGFRIFYRRMAILLGFGFVHLMFIWSGDILMLYALMGMLLPLFRNCSDRTLLSWAAVLLFVPVIIDFACEFAGVSLSAGVVRLQQHYCAKYGITDDNFAYWLRDADSYGGVFQFLVQGALVRVQEFVDGNRYFKVMGLFLIGFCIGRRRMYAHTVMRRRMLRRVALTGCCAGLPLSVVYAWSAVNGHPWGNAAHSLLYFVSVYIVGFAYVAAICLVYNRHPRARVFSLFSAPGRMALTNYIGQSVWGMAIYYGIGLGLGASMGLSLVVPVAVGVWLVEALSSLLWLRFFNFGPLEWIWRMLTYGRRFPLLQKQ
ncbi:DUF418 domain-containing protein [Marseilla massiliensis]|nr:DUF418 domain-containing protein [Marseilla massiliensis]